MHKIEWADWHEVYCLHAWLLRQQGLHYREIAKRVGVHPTTASHYVIRGEELRPRHYDQTDG